MTEVLGWLPLTSANYSTCALKEYNFSWTALTSTNSAIIKLSPPRYFVRQTAFRTATGSALNAQSRGEMPAAEAWKHVIGRSCQMLNLFKCYCVSRSRKLWPVWTLRRQIATEGCRRPPSLQRTDFSFQFPCCCSKLGVHSLCPVWHDTQLLCFEVTKRRLTEMERGGWEIKEGKKRNALLNAGP